MVDGLSSIRNLIILYSCFLMYVADRSKVSLGNLYNIFLIHTNVGFEIKEYLINFGIFVNIMIFI